MFIAPLTKYRLWFDALTLAVTARLYVRALRATVNARFKVQAIYRYSRDNAISVCIIHLK